MQAINAEELVLVRREVSLAEKMAAAVVVTSPETLMLATDTLGRVKEAQKTVGARKTAITAPLNMALKEIRALFAPFEIALERAETLIKDTMLKFKRAEDTRVAAEAAKIRALQEKGRLKPATAEKRLAQIEEAPPVQVRGDRGVVQFKSVRIVEITDESKLPRKYLVPDMVMIRREALAGELIPGVEVREDTQVAAR